MDTAFIDKLQKIETTLVKYDDIAGGAAETARNESGVQTPEKMKAEIEKIADENRLLSIGIIGRVKAGKSSLLNSLFFGGKEVLPKAATPMTAALTVITYSPAPYAEVEFFTKTDIAAIKKEHDDFAALRDKMIKERLEEARERAKKKNLPVDEERIRRTVNRELEEAPKQGSFDQYERMIKSGRNPSKDTEKLEAAKIDDLMGKLSNYVSSSGDYMPFTKSVVLHLPIEALKDIQVVDTPGVNDPVRSRVKRTEDYLGQCDVVFVVASAGDFVSQSDLNLMGHISGRKGVNEVFLVASRSDDELFASIKDEASGNFCSAVDLIKTQLSSQAKEVFINKKKQNPESAEMYDALIGDMKNRVLVTSAICHALYLNFDTQEAWDDDMKHAWGLLTKNYPDYFAGEAAKTNLALIAGVDSVSGNIQTVREMKDDIIAKRQGEYSAKQRKNVDDFLAKIKDDVRKAQGRFESTDVAELKALKASKEKMAASAAANVDDAFDEAVYRFKTELSSTLKQNSRGLFDDVGDFSSYQREETKTRTVTRSREKRGFGSGVARFFGGIFGTDWGYEDYDTTESYTVRTIQTAPIKRKMNDVVQELQDDLADSAEKAVLEWRSVVQTKTISALREAMGDDIDIPLLKGSIRKVIGNMQIPPFSLSSVKFTGDYSGILKDDAVDEFLDAANNYMGELKSAYSSQIRLFLQDMEKSAKKEKLSALLFANMDAELSELEKQIENKESALLRYKDCLIELDKIA